MIRIARVMAKPGSSLEVKDRVWLKMTIPKSFIGKEGEGRGEGCRVWLKVLYK